jgi:hypothetical protein
VERSVGDGGWCRVHAALGGGSGWSLVAPQKLLTICALVVLAMWILSIMDAVILSKYEPMQVVTPVMVILAGFMFYGSARKGD